MAGTFRAQFAQQSVCLDERERIGPHHLAIGKTRKLFAYESTIHAFFSTGYGIHYARVDADSLAIIGRAALNVPVAWGGGAFCVDCDDEGRVALVFVHRSMRELCLVHGRVERDHIAWDNWQPLLATSGLEAAPWLELDPLDGAAWISVLSRDGDFRLAHVRPGHHARIGDLFAPGEARWYHSAVQVLPVGDGNAVAVGFRGTFPTATELVFKTVSDTLALGPSQTLAPCNVNDQLTFHFQAVGDPARKRAHIVYLDAGLSVSHAMFQRGQWKIAAAVMPFAAFAPQICLDPAGNAACLAADYEGAVWSAAWVNGEWSLPRKIDRLVAPAISGAFGRTGYGTGGMISAARTNDGRVPFLIGDIVDDRAARSRLLLSVLGGGKGLELADALPVSVSVLGERVHAQVRLRALGDGDLSASGRRWQAVIAAADGTLLKLALSGGEARATICGRDGTVTEKPARFEVRTMTPFTAGDGDAAIDLYTDLKVAGLKGEGAWVETYDDGTLVDFAPFEPETAARMALDPARIPSAYRRMV